VLADADYVWGHEAGFLGARGLVSLRCCVRLSVSCSAIIVFVFDVGVGQPFSAVNPPGFVPVQGTVSDASAAGFTLMTSTGTGVPVTTSGGTLVVVPHASPGQLQAGATIFALGQAGPDGTLSAQAVAAITQLPSEGRLNVSVRVRDCSPSSIEEALGTISAAPASAG
jgi:hypothetical protein